MVCRSMLVDDDWAAWIARLDDLFALLAGRFFGSSCSCGPADVWLLVSLASIERVDPDRGCRATPDGMQRLFNEPRESKRHPR